MVRWPKANLNARYALVMQIEVAPVVGEVGLWPTPGIWGPETWGGAALAPGYVEHWPSANED